LSSGDDRRALLGQHLGQRVQLNALVERCAGDEFDVRTKGGGAGDIPIDGCL